MFYNLLFLITTRLFCKASLTVPPIESTSEEDERFKGLVISHSYSSQGVSQKVVKLAEPEICDSQNGYSVAGLYTDILGHTEARIFDGNGYEVWQGRGYGPIQNLQAQSYKGQQVLTWWSSNEQAHDQEIGTYHVVCPYLQGSSFHDYANADSLTTTIECLRIFPMLA